MPVDSMSMRALIGMVQALLMPGNCSALSISAISVSTVTPGRHWSSGFRLMMVSNISTGAGSVAVAARPALPNTLATSGKFLDDAVGCLQQLGGLGDRHAGHADRHVHQGALIQRRHKFRAEALERDHGSHQHEQCDQDGREAGA